MAVDTCVPLLHGTHSPVVAARSRSVVVAVVAADHTRAEAAPEPHNTRTTADLPNTAAAVVGTAFRHTSVEEPSTPCRVVVVDRTVCGDERYTV